MAELGVPYELEIPDFSALKQEPFLSVNPNGRMPALEDPNTGIVIWESGACIEHLLDQYDKEGKLQYASGAEKYQQAAWKFFRGGKSVAKGLISVSLGLFDGQWFKFRHPEKNLTSAIDRYANEIKRVFGVIDAHLAKTGKAYLVGDKCTFADLMFVPWNRISPMLLGEGSAEGLEKVAPLAWAWKQRLVERESVEKTYAEMDRLRAEQSTSVAD